MLLGFSGQGFVYHGPWGCEGAASRGCTTSLLSSTCLPESLCAPLWGLQAGSGASTPEQGSLCVFFLV